MDGSSQDAGHRDAETVVQGLAEALRENTARLGTDVHPDLGMQWLEYGDALLSLVETGVSGNVGEEMDVVSEDPQRAGAVISESQTTQGNDDTQECSQFAELEEDLELAWESLETARRCLEMKAEDAASSSLVRCHLRLGDLLNLQGLKESAIEECRKAEKYSKTQEEKGLSSLHLLRLQAELSGLTPEATVDVGEGLAIQNSFAAREQAVETPLEVPVRKRPRVQSLDRCSSGQKPEDTTESAEA
mmetsp:Transcript_61257/g.127010  ORF Transcript_61257/g.127010 Transcript_61257/m.127010 type:complete len:246 (-) Transcript_61257:28-765(-)|eukprot:s1087_g10.t1